MSNRFFFYCMAIDFVYDFFYMTEADRVDNFSAAAAAAVAFAIKMNY